MSELDIKFIHAREAMIMFLFVPFNKLLSSLHIFVVFYFSLPVPWLPSLLKSCACLLMKEIGTFVTWGKQHYALIQLA